MKNIFNHWLIICIRTVHTIITNLSYNIFQKILERNQKLLRILPESLVKIRHSTVSGKNARILLTLSLVFFRDKAKISKLNKNRNIFF